MQIKDLGLSLRQMFCAKLLTIKQTLSTFQCRDAHLRKTSVFCKVLFFVYFSKWMEVKISLFCESSGWASVSIAAYLLI